MRLAILGVGLIGGSVGLAARERLGAQVVGYDPDGDAVRTGLAVGALDAPADDLAAAVGDADLVVVCAPVGRIPAVAADALAAARPDAIVTDVGSAKRDVVAALPDPRFIAGHPLAGAETAGAAGSRADLFDGAPWYLTPTSATSGVHFERLTRFVAGIGARPQAIDAATHDRLMASVSHLPHVIANVMVAQAAQALGGDGSLPATGPSFRDATRVAGANTTMWTDIYLANRDALVDQLDDAVARLQDVRAALVAQDAGAIARWNDAARADREALLQVGLAGGEGPARELRVTVTNRPGIVAEIALALGRAGININDMTLSPSADRRTGEVALWVAADRAGRAAELVAGLGLQIEGEA
ncbi:prephenate dehydrogenase/arogenate dehydrogenase family protein [Conexibacter sp. W3-3-2]|uniref:prephenate dehydrogenase/arogenate dehydrogenase family protein n=1 Tax=Conexibacter sp. W3-3-2 TaxID=2675227 RepID=UPI0018AA0411|nr:prephenate dehydrogenase/arogenate dehydrogenase family protein [Conexibacter sp. W3-3-2]